MHRDMHQCGKWGATTQGEGGHRKRGALSKGRWGALGTMQREGQMPRAEAPKKGVGSLPVCSAV